MESKELKEKIDTVKLSIINSFNQYLSDTFDFMVNFIKKYKGELLIREDLTLKAAELYKTFNCTYVLSNDERLIKYKQLIFLAENMTKNLLPSIKQLKNRLNEIDSINEIIGNFEIDMLIVFDDLLISTLD